MIRWPNRSHRLAIVGRTGSGKTYAALWHLAGKNFANEGWTIIDTKRDELIAEVGNLPGVKHISLFDTPGSTGLHIVRPLPHEKQELDKFLWRIWQRGNHGIYVDEGYMLDDPDSFLAILTQGRSKKIPVIVLSQRPRWITRFLFSEADFFQIFNLQTEDDRATMANLTRRRYNTETMLPEHHSLWYDVGKDSVTAFSPVPPREEILRQYAEQLSELNGQQKQRKAFV